VATVKFEALDDMGARVPHTYGASYFREPSGDSNRLVVGATTEGTQLLCDLAQTFSGKDYYVLYVLVTSRTARLPGRYQSPPFDSYAELSEFLSKYAMFFDGDGRHHIWVGSPSANDLLVYDEHNVIFCYGAIGAFERLLERKGFEEKKFWFPADHHHSFHAMHDSVEEDLMDSMNWKRFELQDADEWK